MCIQTKKESGGFRQLITRDGNWTAGFPDLGTVRTPAVRNNANKTGCYKYFARYLIFGVEVLAQRGNSYYLKGGFDCPDIQLPEAVYWFFSGHFWEACLQALRCRFQPAGEADRPT